MNENFDFDKFLKDLRNKKNVENKESVDRKKDLPKNLFSGFMMNPRILTEAEKDAIRKHG